MASAKGISLGLALVFLSAEAAAAPEPARDAMKKPFAVVFSLDRAVFLGPYTQDGPRGASGLSAAAGGYLRSTDIDTGEPFLPHAAPRIAADLVLPWRLSIGLAGGGGLSVASPDASWSGTEEPDRAATVALVQGRMGYVHPMGPDGIFWFRTGVVYAVGHGEHANPYYQDDRYESRMKHLSVPAEFVFVFPVARHFAFTFGFTAELGLYGTDSEKRIVAGSFVEEVEARRVSDAVGLWFGALGFF